MDLFRTPTIGIIGTAGRRDDAKRLKLDSFDRMYEVACDAIREWGVKKAVSGGAAWADHLAIVAFLDGHVDGLYLHFPAPFAGGTFQGRGDGEIANYYHRQFTAVRGIDSLSEIQRAVDKGAKVTVGKGFKARNLSVGRESSHLLAFTFGQGKAGARPAAEVESDRFFADFGAADGGFMDAAAAGLRDGGTAFHGSDEEAENRRKAYADFGPGSKGFMDAAAAGLRDGGTAFHGSDEEAENRRKAYADFGPGSKGFMDAAAAGLRDSGTEHTWGKAKGSSVKRHVDLSRLLVFVPAPVMAL